MSSLHDATRERDWIVGLQAGRLDVFRAIFEEYSPRLQAFVRLWVPDDVAEDIVQDVLFDLWQRRSTIEASRTSLTAPLFAAVRNRAWQYLRHQDVVQRSEQQQQQVNDETFAPMGMGAGPPSPDAKLLADDFRSAFATALAPLSELQRAVLMLRWTQGLSFAEIASALSITENAAKLHVSRTRPLLVPLLRPILEELE